MEVKLQITGLTIVGMKVMVQCTAGAWAEGYAGSTCSLMMPIQQAQELKIGQFVTVKPGGMFHTV